MKKWMIASIVFALLVSVVSIASADPGNGTNAYTMPARCGGDITVQILNDHSMASFKLGEVHGNVGILKAVYYSEVSETGPWIPIFYVPGNGVHARTETCTWQEGIYYFKSEVLIPHD